jgi:UDP-N-acetyl-D-glucosamine dehydrogenase
MRHRQVPPLCSAPLSAEFLAEQDCVLIATDHSSYDYDFISRHASLIVDTRNATARVSQWRGTIVKA